MKEVKTLFFDVGGTVFDWKNTVLEKIKELAINNQQTMNCEAFANDWRQEMMRIHTEVRYGNLPWINSDKINVLALEHLSEKYPLLDIIDHDLFLKSTWHRLKVFPGAAKAISRLRTKYTVVILSILSFESLVNSSKLGNMQWDAIISCELLGCAKPSLQAYLKGVELLGIKSSEAMMVAAHKGDLISAQATGMRTAYVRVPEDDNVGEGFGKISNDVKFDIEACDFNDLCNKLYVKNS